MPLTITLLKSLQLREESTTDVLLIYLNCLLNTYAYTCGLAQALVREVSFILGDR